MDKQSLNKAWLGLKGVLGALTPEQKARLRIRKHPISYLPWNAPSIVGGAMDKTSAFHFGIQVALKQAGITPNPDPSQVGLPQQQPDFAKERAHNSYMADVGKAKNKFTSNLKNQQIQHTVKQKENQLKAQEAQAKKQQEIAKQTQDLQQNMQQAFSSQPGGVPGMQMPSQPITGSPAGIR